MKNLLAFCIGLGVALTAAVVAQTGFNIFLPGGDLAGAGSTWNSQIITNNAVTNAKLAQMPANTLKGNNTAGLANSTDLTVTQTKTMLALNNVENTALSTWPGSANITTLGTISAGTWNGTAIGSAYLPGSFSGFANPSGLIGMSSANGVAATATRSDATHAIDPAIAPTWTGTHIFSCASAPCIVSDPGSNTIALRIKNNGATNRYIVTDGDDTSTNTLTMQAGGGSDDYGGGIRTYAKSHASFPGDVWIGTALNAGNIRFGVGGIGPGTERGHISHDGSMALGTPTGGDKGNGTLNSASGVYDNGTRLTTILAGTSGSIGGGALLAGACASGTLTVTGATTSMVALTDPNTYPGDGTLWDAQVTSANTVTVKVCAIIAITPTASTYNVRVLQ